MRVRPPLLISHTARRGKNRLPPDRREDGFGFNSPRREEPRKVKHASETRSEPILLLVRRLVYCSRAALYRICHEAHICPAILSAA
jgi:hypothetical protein